MDVGSGRMQTLITGSACEEKGCREEARWYISTDSRAYHLCPKHAIVYMEEERWETEAQAVTQISR